MWDINEIGDRLRRRRRRRSSRQLANYPGFHIHVGNIHNDCKVRRYAYISRLRVHNVFVAYIEAAE